VTRDITGQEEIYSDTSSLDTSPRDRSVERTPVYSVSSLKSESSRSVDGLVFQVRNWMLLGSPSQKDTSISSCMHRESMSVGGSLPRRQIYFLEIRRGLCGSP
jgi:hypothetical protein